MLIMQEPPYPLVAHDHQGETCYHPVVAWSQIGLSRAPVIVDGRRLVLAKAPMDLTREVGACGHLRWMLGGQPSQEIPIRSWGEGEDSWGPVGLTQIGIDPRRIDESFLETATSLPDILRCQREPVSETAYVSSNEDLKGVLAWRVPPKTIVVDRNRGLVLITNEIPASITVKVTGMGQADIRRPGTYDVGDKAQVWAYNKVNIIAHGHATVHAYNASTVEATDYATVHATGGAVVTATGRSVVKADGPQTLVLAGEQVVVYVNGCPTVIATRGVQVAGKARYFNLSDVDIALRPHKGINLSNRGEGVSLC